MEKTLTYQRERFCQAIVSGKNQSDAYREAYPKSLSWKPETVWNNASKLIAITEVITRIESLRSELAKQQLWTREDSVKTLKEVISDIEARPSDKTGAVKELNAMHGYNAPIVIKHEVEWNQQDEERLKFLLSKAGL
jgi:hypothetical protein